MRTLPPILVPSRTTAGVVAAVAFGLVVIGCGGGGGGTPGLTTGTTSTTSTSATTATTSTSATTSTTSTGSTGGTTTGTGTLPPNVVLFTNGDDANGYLRQVTPDGANSSVIAQYPLDVVAIAPNPSKSDVYAFVSGAGNPNGPFRLYRGNSTVNSANATVLTNQSYYSVTDIAYSPDGNTIFFVANLTDSDAAKLYKISDAGGTPEVLDTALSFAVSPVGEKIVYAKDNATFSGSDLYVRDYSATSAGSRISPLNGENIYPSFDRSGTKVVYAYTSTVAGATYDLFQVNADGTGNVQLTNTGNLDEFGASYNTDGTEIAYTALSGDIGGSGVYAQRVDGGNVRQLIADSSINFDVYWTSTQGRGITLRPRIVLRRPKPINR